MPAAFVLVGLAGVIFSRSRYFKVRRVPPWRSASPGVDGPASYSAFGFANPLRHVLANLLGTRRLEMPAESVADQTRARGRVEYTVRVIEPVETYLYRPIRSGALGISRLLKRLQSGHLEAYVAYMLLAVIIALAITAATR